MRFGVNPAKEDVEIERGHYHRVIVPVFIPNLDGYFSSSLEVLRISLDSLFCTVHERVAVTIIDNSSCREVKELIDEYFDRGLIDQVIVNSNNAGKVDPLMCAIRGSYEPLITIADNDVLFLPGWITEVERSIEAFPEIGMISPCPIPFLWNYYTSTVFLTSGFRIKNAEILGREKLMFFPKSVMKPDMYVNCGQLLETQSYLERDGVKVLLGAGHFVATLRREVFEYSPRAPSLKKITGGSERAYIDVPVDMGGFYRVGTERVLAHHMGNTAEDWMRLELSKIMDAEKPLPYFKGSLPAVRRKWMLDFIPFLIRQHYLGFLSKTRFLRIFGVRLTD